MTGIMNLDKVNRALYGTHMTSKKGIITSRRCPSCGHHEVGYTNENGVFYPLKPGTMIHILDGQIDRDEVTTNGHARTGQQN